MVQAFLKKWWVESYFKAVLYEIASEFEIEASILKSTKQSELSCRQAIWLLENIPIPCLLGRDIRANSKKRGVFFGILSNPCKYSKPNTLSYYLTLIYTSGILYFHCFYMEFFWEIEFWYITVLACHSDRGCIQMLTKHVSIDSKTNQNL